MIASQTNGAAMDTESGPKSRQQRRLNKTRKKLLKAARDVFSEKGLDYATIDEITERADVGRGTFYYHFDDKDDLIRSLTTSILEELTEQIQQRCKDLDDLNALLEAMISGHIDFFRNRWADFVIYYQGRADITLEQGYEGLDQAFVPYLDKIETLIDGAVEQPISKPRLRRLACAIAGFISGYYSFASVATDDEDVDKSFMSLKSAFVASLAKFIREALPGGPVN